MCSIVYNCSDGKLSSKKIIGNRGIQQQAGISKYKIYIPTDMLLAKISCDVQVSQIEPSDSGTTLTQRQTVFHKKKEFFRLSIQDLSYTQRLQVVQQISTYLSNNKANYQQDESLSDFLQRQCHRDKINSCYWKNSF